MHNYKPKSDICIIMWTIFGTEALYIDIPDVFKKEILAHSPEDEGAEKFAGFMEKTEVLFLLNGETEENSFLLKVPDELTPDDIQFMADRVMEIIRTYDQPPVIVDGKEQRYKIVISNNHEPELIGIRKTPGMSSYEIFKPIIEGWSSPGRKNTNPSAEY